MVLKDNWQTDDKHLNHKNVGEMWLRCGLVVVKIKTQSRFNKNETDVINCKWNYYKEMEQ